MVETTDILKQLISDLTLLTKRTMIENGVEEKSDLIKSIEFIPSSSGLQLLANDYYQYVSTGRKPKARKVPIEDLIEWVKKYSIGSGNVNQTAWAIQQSIYKRGIIGKGYENPVEEGVADMSSEQLAEVLSEVIADEMVIAFDPLTK